MASYGNQSDALLHSSTYSNYVEECAIALKTIEILEDSNFISKMNDSMSKLDYGINNLLKLKQVKSITGTGFHYGIEFKKLNLLGIEKLIKLIRID